MSKTTILSPEDGSTLHLTQFYGGAERGVCHQITIPSGEYVQLTRAQMWELCLGFLMHMQFETALGRRA